MSLDVAVDEQFQERPEPVLALHAEELLVELERAARTVSPFSAWPILSPEYHRLSRQVIAERTFQVLGEGEAERVVVPVPLREENAEATVVGVHMVRVDYPRNPAAHLPDEWHAAGGVRREDDVQGERLHHLTALTDLEATSESDPLALVGQPHTRLDDEGIANRLVKGGGVSAVPRDLSHDTTAGRRPQLRR